MRATIFISTCILFSSLIKGQMKEGAMMVNETQKKIFVNGGQSANLAWYTIYEKPKDKDTVLQKSYIVDKKIIDATIDSLMKIGYSLKFKKENVSDAQLKISLLDHKFVKTDTVKKEGGKFTVDSIFVLKMMVNIHSEKEKLNKNRIYSPKYTSLNRSKLEAKLKKYKDFTLAKFANAGIYELNLMFDKVFMISQQSFYKSFEAGEREFL